MFKNTWCIISPYLMRKRCPPGVLCIENVTLFAVLLIFGGVMYCLSQMPTHEHEHQHSHIHGRAFHFPKAPPLHDALRNEMDQSQRDVLRNPYDPPLRMPINVPTQSIDASYRQVGILTNGNHILPLMGRPLFTNRDKWNFYTMTDKSNMIKLPILYKGKNCTGEYGCQNVYSNDEVHVEGYNDTFQVTMYENDTLRYIPQL